jgi:hypothetical protein
MSSSSRVPLVVALLAVFAGAALAKDPTPEQLAKLRREKAQQVFEGLIDGLNAPPDARIAFDRGHFELIYQWSRRWLDADQELANKDADRLTALERHLVRMKKLSQVVEALLEAGAVSRIDRDAADFYRLEAEAWLRKARKAK